MVFPLMGLSQTNKSGIGLFQVGKTTTSIIKTLSDETSVQVSQVNLVPMNYNDSKTTRIMEIIPDGGELSSLYAPRVPQERVFYLDCYFISGVLLKDLYLGFWNDTLHSISCKGANELDEAMTVKFGKGKEQEVVKDVACRNGLGITFTKQERTVRTSWNVVPGKILAYSVYRYFFDDKCQPDSYYRLDIYNTLIARKKLSIIQTERAKKQKEDEDSLKKRLKGF